MEIDFPGLDEHSNIDEIYNTCVRQLTEIINSVAPFSEIRVKNNTPNWFVGEIMDEIRKRNKLHQKYKCTKLEEDGLHFRSSRNKVGTGVRNQIFQNLVKSGQIDYYDDRH